MAKKKNSFGDIAAVGSALVGAALGAAAVLLTDKKNQEKLKKTVDEVTSESVKIGKSIKKRAEELTKDTIKNTKATKKPAKKIKVVAKKKAAPKKVYTPLKKD